MTLQEAEKAMRLTSEEMAKKLADAKLKVPPRSQWRHKKGGKYYVLGYAIDTDNGEVRVRYKRIDGPFYNIQVEIHIEYVRPISEWTVDRFQRIS